MKTIFCIDNSTSTRGVERYWEKVNALYLEKKPSILIYWNSSSNTSQSIDEIKNQIRGCTMPQCFIPCLEIETEPFDLVITTDGEILDNDIRLTKEKLEKSNVVKLLQSVQIYYVGKPSAMNIGLNIIFSKYNENVQYCINDDSVLVVTKLNKFEDLTCDEVLSENFLISLTTHIYNIGNDQKLVNELRGSICRLFGRLENSFTSTISTEEYRLKNMKKQFLEDLRNDMEKVKPISKIKSQALALFDKKLDLSLSRLYTANEISEQTLSVDETENSVWESLECAIISINFKLPCLLIKNVEKPFILNKKHHVHPFLILSDEELLKEILRNIEPNLIDYTTYQKLEFRDNYVRSPFTRDLCKGVFALDVPNMTVVKNNCRAISSFFSEDDKVPGNLVIWNLIFMYIISRFKLDDLQEQEKAIQSIINYCETLKFNLSLTQFCQIYKSEKLSLCFWFCLEVGPSEVPNTSRNVLRSPFGLELLEFYLYVFHNKSTLDCIKEDDEDKKKELKLLTEKAKKWKVWNYLISNRIYKKQLYFEVMAQEQNYHVLNDNDYILVSGKCQKPFKSVLNLVSPSLSLALYENIDETSMKTQNIDNIEESNLDIFKIVEDYDNDLMRHVKINIQTCWPYVICPVTKMHWKDCIGTYDIKRGSLFRLFNRYCLKYNSYPKSPTDLILFYNKVCNFPIFPENYLIVFNYVFIVFEEIMTSYDCNTYLSIYARHVSEEIRLSKE